MKKHQYKLNLYGAPLSQPVRAVIWVLLYKKQNFDLILMNPGSKGSIGTRNPTFLAKNPFGTIPFLEDKTNDVSIAEASAILIYLSRVNEWHDLYPLDPRNCSKVDWYLHSHHRGIRDAALAYFAPNIRKDLSLSDVLIDIAKKSFSRSLEVLEHNWLAKTQFIAGQCLSIADFMAYSEIGQMKPEFTNVFDFETFPNVKRWMRDMASFDGHNDAHLSLNMLGDISSSKPSIEKIVNANKAGYETIMNRQKSF
tara:strand:- start:4203 stop:4961 length:759 start_codon:yes stop_codon:yes gene_type:complete